ncbi:MAG: TatD family hydrolase [Coriobacteriales bacterium]|jgi:TatD DNase family protein
MHCHLAFSPDRRRIAEEARGAGAILFSNTVTPEEFSASARELAAFAPTPGQTPLAMGRTAESGGVVVGLGLHPWQVESHTLDDRLARFDELAAGTAVRLFGEVGLDFGARHEREREAQLAAFEHVCRVASASAPPGTDDGEDGTAAPHTPRRPVLSVHAVRAAGAALDVLQSTGCLRRCTCVFHRFSGTSDELRRAIRAGCWFSVGSSMARTRRGLAYARQIPVERLLLETDLPSAPGQRCDLATLEADLALTLSALASARGVEDAALAATVEANARGALGLSGAVPDDPRRPFPS